MELGKSMKRQGISLLADSNMEILQQLEFIRRQTLETEETLQRIEQELTVIDTKWGELDNLIDNWLHLQNQPQNPQYVEIEMKVYRKNQMLEQILNQKVDPLMQLRLTLAEKLKYTVSHLSTLQSRVLDEELIRWKRDQQLQGIGAQVPNNLDNLQEWCENLAELIWNNRDQIKRTERLKVKLPPGVHDILPTLNNQITQLLSSLFFRTFIIEKQPPQVMKTNTRFTSTVRLLVGGKLNVYKTRPQVRITIISEQQANALLKNDKMPAKRDVRGEILNNTGTMEYNQATRQLSVSFPNMQLKKIKRAEKKGTLSVTDEKFFLLFQSQFPVGGGELVLQVWTLSLPVVVIVHVNQEPHAWATITWDNAFSEAGHIPFIVPDKVAWHQVAHALNMKFIAGTGRALTKENMRFLAEKAFRNAQAADYSNMLLTWSQFCKEPLPDRNFTFWEWFYAIKKLTREHLRSLWTDGSILGFVPKKQAEEMLAACASGTFLLRFCDSVLGGIIIARVKEQSEESMAGPFTSKDFAVKSLANCISDLRELVYLYPDIPKDQAFGKYYTPFSENEPNPSSGYVKPILVTHIPGRSHTGSLGNYPGTPQNMYQQQYPDPNMMRDAPVSIAVSDSVSSYPGILMNMDDDVLFNNDPICDDVLDFPNIDAEDLDDVNRPTLYIRTNPNSNMEILQQLEFIRRQTLETEETLQRIEQELTVIDTKWGELENLIDNWLHLQNQPQNPQYVEIEMKVYRKNEMLGQILNQKVDPLMQLRLTLTEKLKYTVSHLSTLQSRVLDEELIRWKRDQQLQGIGAQVPNNLDNLQEWCENLAELIWNNRDQIKRTERLKVKLPPGVHDILPTLNNQITQLLSSLFFRTFIIEKQPPQVMKTNTRFTSTVRLLVGGKLNVYKTRPQVRITIISEQQANALLKNDKMPAKRYVMGEILNNTGIMEYNQETRQLSVSFRNMQLKKIKRAEKKGTLSVTDEKFFLLFQSQFPVGGGELVLQVWTLSLPVVVIVHVNQEPHAWATITWDNAFSEAGHIPFIVPDKVAWHQVAHALNMKFIAGTGRALTKENMRFLAEKAFRNVQTADYSNMLLTWSQFCKEPLPDRNFTFWEWFYAIKKLTREHLRSLWTDGSILGFVPKKQAEEMLAACASGTFLLRFCDSVLGGIIIIARVKEQSEVSMAGPFTSKDFAVKSLANCISDLRELVYLYPDIPKDQAFGKYYTPFSENQPNPSSDYVKPILVTHVPGWSHTGSLGSYHGTPQNMYQQQYPDPNMMWHSPFSTAVSDSVSSYPVRTMNMDDDDDELISIDELMKMIGDPSKM